jgi:hypothetical protein
MPAAQRRGGRPRRPPHALDLPDDALALGHAAMRHQPARALGMNRRSQQDRETQHGADAERDAPARIRRQQSRIEQHHRADAPPSAAPIQKLPLTRGRAAAVAGRHQLLDRRVDGRVFAADARAGEQAEQRERCETRPRTRSRGRQQVGPRVMLNRRLPPPPVREPPEHQRSDDGAEHVEARGQADLRVGEMRSTGLSSAHRTLHRRASPRARRGST